MNVPKPIFLVALAFAACASKAITDPTATAQVGSVAVAGASSAAPNVKTAMIVLYQPEEVMQARVLEVKALADYAKGLEAACADYFAGATRPETLHIVIAVKPGKRARVWFVSDTRKLESLAPLRDKLQAVVPLEVFHGPVAFGLQMSIAGGAPGAPSATDSGPPPIPQEWRDSAKGEEGPLTVPDDFLKKVWPDEPGSTVANQPTPPGFVNQVLEPLGGVIFKPKDWFYNEDHHGPSFLWTLSKEESTKGGYTTGVRIQAIVGVKKNSGQTAESFIMAHIAKKRKAASRVVSDCGSGTEQQGLRRMCLETEEGVYHIQYSLFFSTDDADLAVVMTAGTTKELWPQFSSTFQAMRDFQLLDMNHIQKQVPPAH